MIREIPSGPPLSPQTSKAGASQVAVPGVSSADSATGDGTEGTAPALQKKQLNRLVAQLNDYVQGVQRELRFNIDEENGEVVIKVVDARTQDVVREIPPEEIREMRKRLSEAAARIFESGGSAVLFRAKA